MSANSNHCHALENRHITARRQHLNCSTKWNTTLLQRQCKTLAEIFSEV